MLTVGARYIAACVVTYIFSAIQDMYYANQHLIKCARPMLPRLYGSERCGALLHPQSASERSGNQADRSPRHRS
jgi:hypothetical protein